MLYLQYFQLNVKNCHVWFTVVDSEDVDVVPISPTDTEEDFIVGEGRTVWCENSCCYQVSVY